MKLWILSPVKNLPKNDDPWEPWFDKAFGFVVRAETESEARKLAMESAGDEGHHNRPWLDPKYSTCVELSNDGEIGVVMRDFASA